ncbi:hypothetical protein [Paraburkholderia hospita]|jgi:endonuclease G|uniref:hypothetical protein n=1 Tax=Paraburkholderia hospita TaxID=169430 RepID=UPI0005867830|nr:hypothetical protein [Paraburkholderia hospita]SEI15956.1 hypothetical protein SAMN05192544_102714 [Paraburkholderia hospita]
MDLATTTRLQLFFRERLARQTSEIERSLRQIAAGNPLGAEPDQERSTRRMAYKTGLSARDAAALAGIIRQTAGTIDAGIDIGLFRATKRMTYCTTLQTTRGDRPVHR